MASVLENLNNKEIIHITPSSPLNVFVHCETDQRRAQKDKSRPLHNIHPWLNNKEKDWSHPKLLFSCKKDPRIKVPYNPRSENKQLREVYTPQTGNSSTRKSSSFLLFSTQQWLPHLPGKYSRCPTHAPPVCFLRCAF